MQFGRLMKRDFAAEFACLKIRAAKDPFLGPAVLDLQLYDDVLVAFIDQQITKALAQSLLDQLWQGEVEVHCASDLIS